MSHPSIAIAIANFESSMQTARMRCDVSTTKKCLFLAKPPSPVRKQRRRITRGRRKREKQNKGEVEKGRVCKREYAQKRPLVMKRRKEKKEFKRRKM